MKKIFRTTWEALIFAVVFVGLFYCAGVGLYLGAINTTAIGELTAGKAIVITILNLEKMSEDDE